MSPREPLSKVLWAICNDVETLVSRWPERDRTLRGSLEQTHAASRLLATWVDRLDDPLKRRAYADRSIDALMRDYEDAGRAREVLRGFRTSLHRALNENISATALLQVSERARTMLLTMLQTRHERVEDFYGPNWALVEKPKGRPPLPLPHDRVMDAIRRSGGAGVGVNGLLRALQMKHSLLRECLQRLQQEKRVRCKRGPRNAMIYFTTEHSR